MYSYAYMDTGYCSAEPVNQSAAPSIGNFTTVVFHYTPLVFSGHWAATLFIMSLIETADNPLQHFDRMVQTHIAYQRLIKHSPQRTEVLSLIP